MKPIERLAAITLAGLLTYAIFRTVVIAVRLLAPDR